MEGIIDQSYYDITSMLDRYAKFNAKDVDMFLQMYRDKLKEKMAQKRVWQWNAVSLKDLLGDNE